MPCSETEREVYNYLNEHRGSRIETQVLMDNLKVHLGIGGHGNGDLPRILFGIPNPDFGILCDSKRA